jgi:hypothetical protein
VQDHRLRIEFARLWWMNSRRQDLVASYRIALRAKAEAPVAAAVAALCETSVVYAAMLGSVFLRGSFGGQRLVGACAVSHRGS